MLADLSARLMVKSGSRVHLSAIDPDATHGHRKNRADEELAAGITRLADLQDRLWAEGRHAVLVVLQGIDASGKDGTIQHVMGAFNPQGCSVFAFKVPTPIELAHDYLWRIHQRVPAHGEIGVFNRSHYESVLVERVESLVPKAVWARRYAQINTFEGTLAAAGTTIVKFFLHIDRAEQRRRFEGRLTDPTKSWKFRLADLEVRRRWDDYMAAYEEALSRCSTDVAPWYVIPANKKWFRNLAVAEILADILDGLNPQYPEPEALPPGFVID
ncbi:MAG: polyphosphate kinase 2 family protein [Chloroflexota bacterium]|nr:polyphosphate kinase 2 family protein [Chloroflexota bacterium]